MLQTGSLGLVGFLEKFTTASVSFKTLEVAAVNAGEGSEFHKRMNVRKKVYLE